MKKTHIISIAILAVMCATGAQAQNRTTTDSSYYGEIGYSPVEVSNNGGDATPDVMRFLIGTELNKNFALEAMYMMTTHKDSRVGYEAKMSGFGIFLKPKMALSDSTEVFSRAGVMRSEITASASGAHKGTDLAYGVGIQTNFTKSVYGQLDYMTSYDRDNVSAKGYTLSLGMRY
jgi:hypothetical protein